MAYYLNPGALVAGLSGLAMVLLGMLVLGIKPRKPASLAFSAFAVLWGAEVMAANVSQMALDPETTLPWARLFVLLFIPLYLPVLYFASAHPWPTNALARQPVVLALAAAPAGALLLLFLALPGLFVAGVGVNPADGLPFTEAGPLLEPVVGFNSVLVFAIALVIVARKLLSAKGEAARDQLVLLTAAFLVYVSYRGAAALFLAIDFGLVAQFLGLRDAALQLLALGGCLVAAAWVVASVARRPDLPRKDLVLATAGLAFGFGLLEGFLGTLGVFAFSTVGVWRLAMVGLFAYAIARYKLFDVEVRLRSLAPAATYVALVVVGLAALWGLAGSQLLQTPFLGVLASVGLAAACAPAIRLGRGGAFRLAPDVGETDYLYKRKMDVYRAALEEAQARGAGERTEQVFLSQLRRDLGISEQEHRVLMLVLQGQQRYAKPAPSSATASRFRIERELGRGSYGRAVLAHDTMLERKVVLKQPLVPWMLDREGRERFLQEARVAARIQHPNVVALHEVMPDEDPPMLVLEYVEGGSLEDMLHKLGSLEPARAVRLGLDVLAGLERIHKAGIVHRDLKPGNILLDAEGKAKITDFGIARPPRELAKAATVATQGSQPGSLAYMSPEQARGDEVDARSDLYALGAVLYQCLAGRHYLDLRRRGEFALRQAIQDEAPTPLTGVPPALDAVVRKSLAKTKEQRYQDASAMAEALAAARARLTP